MANRWLQTKQYRCPRCGAIYLHDKAHPHAVFECPSRQPKTKRQVFIGKTYEPKPS